MGSIINLGGTQEERNGKGIERNQIEECFEHFCSGFNRTGDFSLYLEKKNLFSKCGHLSFLYSKLNLHSAAYIQGSDNLLFV